jgi:hypothetical protein
MKQLIFMVVMMVGVASWGQKVDFEKCFADKTLRIDYLRCGNSEWQEVKLVRYVDKSAQWAGSKTRLIDPINNGDYRVTLADKETGEALYSRTYNTLFSEYCGTGNPERVEYQEVVLVPYPKKAIDIRFERRNPNQQFYVFMVVTFDPDTTKVEKVRGGNKVKKLRYEGDVHGKNDLVIVAQGYEGQKKKLKQDYKRFVDVVLAEEPFASRKEDFNFWGVAGDAGANYGTLGADRYLMTDSLFKLHDLLDKVPFDHILIVVNNEKYGGGGIYNFYAVASTNVMADMVTPHELGHSIGGLADEYVDENLSYTEIYKGGFEPVEPNITSLVDFEKKWKDLLPEGTKIPTEPVKGLGKRDCGPIGVYEGAGYQSKGLYRPVTNCMMNYYAHFCPVCQRALNKVLDLYSRP